MELSQTPAANDPAALPQGYAEWIAEVKARVRTTQFRAARAANTEVLRLYWSIGHDILVRQRDAGWGAKVVQQVSHDLQREFPGQSGWSRRNLMYMRTIAEVWPTENEFVQHVAAQLPWGHIMVLLDQLSTREDRDWYAAKAVEEGWSRNVLRHFIKVDLRGQLGSALTNFQMLALPCRPLRNSKPSSPPNNVFSMNGGKPFPDKQPASSFASVMSYVTSSNVFVGSGT
jgi:predicted nuclease of restriction endonuclease-like (RecB) superfamily